MDGHRDKTPEVTLAVVTFNRPELLVRCLEALELEARSCGGAEILVIDDGSTVADDVVAAVATAPSARLIRQAHAGVAAARNSVAQEALGRYVCFTDDDCVPVPGWCSALVPALRSDAKVIAGPTLNAKDNDRLAAASQLVTNWLLDTDAAARERTRFAPGSNFACRRELLLEFPQEERYGPIGGEDRDWCARLAAAGVEIVYEDRAQVLHRPALTLALFWSKYVRYGRAAWLLRGDHGRQLLGANSHLQLLLTGFRSGVRMGLLVAIAQLATLVGVLRQLIAGRTPRRERDDAERPVSGGAGFS